MENSTQTILSKVADYVMQLNLQRGEPLTNEELKSRMQATIREGVTKILDEVKKDAKEADLFGNLDRGKIDPLVTLAASVALNHACLMYAKTLFI